MSDNLQNRGAQDRSRIALGEKHERDYWERALGATREELEAAVAAVGPSAEAVREYLSKRNRS